MKLNVLTVLTGVEGHPLPITDQQGRPVLDAETKAPINMVLADVLINAVMSPPAPGKSYTPSQQIERYDLGIATHKARASCSAETADIEVSSAMAAALKDDICRMYAPVVAGQVLPMLDGK